MGMRVYRGAARAERLQEEEVVLAGVREVGHARRTHHPGFGFGVQSSGLRV